MTEGERLRARVPEELAGARLDQALARLFPDYSRSRLKQWIDEGRVTVDARAPRAKDRLTGGEAIEVRAVAEPEPRCEPQALPLEIVFEDEALLVIDKPPGTVVHPAAGHRDGTLQNALLHYDPGLAQVPRSGLVHRLDKDTSGLLVVARSERAHRVLVERMQARRVEREYDAVVRGQVIAGGRVEGAIGRHPVDRKRMAVTPRGREAATHYRVVERYRAHTRLAVRLETGRTHQIRVHMAHIGYPLVGDPTYGGRGRLAKGASEPLRAVLASFRRQALHAGRLALEHPISGERLEFRAPLPDDMARLVEALRTDNQL